MREKKEEKKEVANVAVADVDQQSALFLASTSSVVHAPFKSVHLMEKEVFPIDCADDVWVLDTGASNHMTGTRSALT
jgi:hypothetical protein